MSPSLAGMSLVATPLTASSGAAFSLLDGPVQGACIEMDGYTIEVTRRIPVVIVRGGSQTQASTAFTEALDVVQRALDYLSLRGLCDVAIHNAHDEHMVWWRDGSDNVLRITSIETTRSHMSATATVLGANGNPKPTPASFSPTWHTSARYFRLSQTTSDLFDAYRNAFLALEAMLDHVRPHGRKANGKPDGGESEWFKAALDEANKTTPLSNFVPAGTPDPIDWMYRHIYGAVRSAMSHAKQQRSTLLPRDESNRSQVIAALELTSRLYLAMVQKHLNITHMAGGFTYDGFRLFYEPFLQRSAVVASDDESAFDATATSFVPAGGNAIAFADGQISSPEPFLVTKLATADRSALDRLPFLHRIGTMAQDNVLTVSVLPGRLYVDSLDRIEALVGYRNISATGPRTQFSM